MEKQRFEEKEGKKTKEPAPQIKQHNNLGGEIEKGAGVPLLGR